MNASEKDSSVELISFTITPAEEREYYPLTTSQKGIFLQYREESTDYNTSCCITIEGSLDILRFENSLKTIVKRHDAFRTFFVMVDGEPMQKIQKDLDFSVKFLEVDEGEERAAIADFIVPFNLSEAPLVRACLIKTGQQRYICVLDMHHIITDGTSMGILVNEIIALYRGETLPEQTLQYKDYAVWYNQLLETSFMEKQKAYWEQQLSGELPILNFPADFHDWMNQPVKSDGMQFALPLELSKELRKLAGKYARKYHITLNTVIFSIYALLLNKYTGQDELIIGTISSGRNNGGLRNIIGAFINVLPIRIQIQTEKPFLDFMIQVKDTFLSAYENQNYPMENIIGNMSLLTKDRLSPLFDTMLVFHGVDSSEPIQIDDSGLKMSKYNLIRYTGTSGLKMDVSISSIGQVHVRSDYNSAMISKKKMDNIERHFINIVSEVVKNAEQIISEINILSPEEEKQILHGFNDTQTDYPANISLSQLFERMVRESGDSIAIEYDNGSVSYRELNEKANKVAWFLNSKGVGQDMLIGVMVRRSLEMITAILGILKAGAAYVPIDPDYPEDRIRYLLEDSKVSIVLGSRNLSVDVGEWRGDLICVEDILDMQDLPVENLDIEYHPDRLMYVLYTSGSTGKPKGAMIKAHAFVNLLTWFIGEFGINKEDNNLFIAPVSFDLAQKNLYATLICGGKLSLYPPGYYDYNVMSDIILERKITIINCAPGAFYPLVGFNQDTGFEKIKTLRYVFLGGEPINLMKLDSWMKADSYGCEIVNTYGPTECTDITTAFRVKKGDYSTSAVVPIGKPIYNTKVYILDKDMKPVPLGVDGELCIGGIGLARGYFEKPELTAEKFVKCPHLFSEIVYRTGDLARWFPDGNIEFRGRIDRQVKINGYRIELEEIEKCFLRHSAVKDVLVIDRTDKDGAKYLCAYVVLERALGGEELMKYLSNELPHYMIPSFLVEMEKLPLSPNGKMDRSALPEPDTGTNIEEEYVEPANDIEEKLVEIWKQVLNRERLGVMHNLFKLGANSLKIIVGASRINKELGVQVKLTEIFNLPTIRGMADYIASEAAATEAVKDEVDLDSIEFNF
jgi:amino acid adenylation domain-containing protein